MEHNIENPVLESIFSRRSCRKFIDKPVPEQMLNVLVAAGMAAPTAKNLQPWHFVVVTNREVLNALGEALPYAKMLFTATAAIVVCADTDINNNGIRYWEVDCSAATQNILLAAHSMGLGAVWTATHPYPERLEPVAKIVKLPANITSLCVVPIGFPESKNEPKDKYDESKIHYQQF